MARADSRLRADDIGDPKDATPRRGSAAALVVETGSILLDETLREAEEWERAVLEPVNRLFGSWPKQGHALLEQSETARSSFLGTSCVPSAARA